MKGRPQHVTVSLGPMFDRVPPQAPEAEAAILGAMLLDPSSIPEAMSVLPHDLAFYSEAHRAIYRALVHNWDTSRGADLTSLIEGLRTLRILEDVGGIEYLERLAKTCPGPMGVKHWAKIVADKHRLRSVIEAAGRAVHTAYTAGEDSEAALQEMERAVFEACQQTDRATSTDLASAVEETFQTMQSAAIGIPTGIPEIDGLIHGCVPGEMTIIAARPSQGKTSLAMQIAYGMAEGGHRAGFFSLEMSRQEISRRLMCSLARVSAHKAKTGGLTDDDIDRVSKSNRERMDTLRRIHVDDRPTMTVQDIRVSARRLAAKHACNVFCVDYLQLMTSGGRHESRQVEVAEISRGLKALAKELAVPMIVVAQLNRESESRSNNRPRMSDLRESGAIEQDADVIMLVHREEQHHVGNDEWRRANADKIGLAEIIIAKNRNGPAGSVELEWRGDITWFGTRDQRAHAYGEYPQWN